MSFRVIHVASGREWRGGQRQVWYLAEALAARKVDQLVVTGGGTRLERELRDSSCPVSGVTWSSALDPRALLGLMRAIRTPHPSPTILHAHDPHALILAALAAGWHRLPLVVTRRVDFPLRRTLPWRRADRVVAISQAVKGILEQSGIPSERIVVVPSGIPLNHAPPAAMDLRSALGLPPNARLAVSVGALVAHKDYPTLVRAAARLRELRPALHWVVAGEGRERSQLELLSRDLGVERAVHFIGQVDDGRSVIASGDVFVATSSEEGLNTSVLDALALGIPVVSTRAGGLPEAVGYAGVLCSGGDAKAVAHAVLALLDDPARHATFARAGPRQAAQFSSDRMAEGMLTVYHSVAPFT